VATLDIDPAGAGDPGADAGHRERSRRRPAHGGRCRPRWRREDHRTAFEQIPGAQRKTAGVPVPVFQLDTAVFDADHCPDIAGLYILHDQAQLGGVLGRARLAPAGGEDIGSIAIHHAPILGSLAAKRRRTGLACPPEKSIKYL
jgi:hypothetical protein